MTPFDSRQLPIGSRGISLPVTVAVLGDPLSRSALSGAHAPQTRRIVAPSRLERLAGEGFILTRYSSIDDVRAAWAALQEKAQTHPFQSLHWHDAWANAVSLKPEHTVIVVLRDTGANALALWPLYTVTRAGAARWLMPMAQLDSDYCSPLIAPELVDVARPAGLAWLFGEVLSIAGNIDGWSAKGQPEDEAWYSMGTVICGPQRAYLANLGHDFQCWHDAARSRATRKKDRYRDKQLAAAGGMAFEVVGGGATAMAITAHAIAMKRAQMAAKGLDSSFERRACATPTSTLQATLTGR